MILASQACRVLLGCTEKIHDQKFMKKIFRQAIKDCGGHIRGKIKVTSFNPEGAATYQAVLEESNADLIVFLTPSTINLHTYKELENSLLVDILTCSKAVSPLKIVQRLAELTTAKEICKQHINFM